MIEAEQPAKLGGAMRTRCFALAALGAAALPHSTVAQERQWGSDRSIEQISEHVYRWGSDGQAVSGIEESSACRTSD